MEYREIDYQDNLYPKRLLQIKNYPQKLYALGNYELLNVANTVAIIGSRNCTEYGRKYANIFASELSKKGVCVVSGLAVGIDAIAHTGALSNRRKNHSSIRWRI